MKKQKNKLRMTAQMFKVMGHPFRITIINALGGAGQLSVREISKVLKVTSNVTSYHLNRLKDAGVLRSERAGKNTLYSVSHRGITDAVNSILDA